MYVRAGHRLIKQRQYGGVRQLLKCVGESGTATRHDCDTLILSCVSAADKIPADVSDRNAFDRGGLMPSANHSLPCFCCRF